MLVHLRVWGPVASFLRKWQSGRRMSLLKADSASSTEARGLFRQMPSNAAQSLLLTGSKTACDAGSCEERKRTFSWTVVDRSHARCLAVTETSVASAGTPGRHGKRSCNSLSCAAQSRIWPRYLLPTMTCICWNA